MNQSKYFLMLLLLSTSLYSMNYHAVCVGINTYPDPWPDLNYATYDAADIHNALLDYQHFDDSNLKTNSQAFREGILYAIECMPRSYGNTCVFYFSGHGTTDGIITYDAGCISPSDLQAEFGTYYNQYACFIDACYSGVFPEDMEKGVICSACDDNEEIGEYEKQQNSIYTYFVEKKLHTYGTCAEDVHAYAKPRTEAFPQASQEPQINDNFGGKLYLSCYPPTYLTITNAGSYMQNPILSWVGCSKAASYEVFRKGGITDLYFTKIADVTSTTYTDPDVFIVGESEAYDKYYYYVIAYYDYGSGVYTVPSNTVSTWGEIQQNIEEINKQFEGSVEIPEEFSLSQNYPNPANPTTTIHYSMPEAGQVKLTIYNIQGQVVSTLIDGYVEAGYQTATWNGKGTFGNAMPSGIYIYRLSAGGKVFTKRLTLMK